MADEGGRTGESGEVLAGKVHRRSNLIWEENVGDGDNWIQGLRRVTTFANARSDQTNGNSNLQLLGCATALNYSSEALASLGHCPIGVLDPFIFLKILDLLRRFVLIMVFTYVLI